MFESAQEAGAGDFQVFCGLGLVTAGTFQCKAEEPFFDFFQHWIQGGQGWRCS